MVVTFTLFISCLGILLSGFYLAYILFELKHGQIQSHFECELSKRMNELIQEKNKVEQLLSRVLPKTAVEEIQSQGKIARKRYSMVTVMFADVEGFCTLADSLNQEYLIDLLDKFYFDLDGIIERFGIEKIKTIGDAYMCAGGIPERNSTNPVEVVLAGLAMQEHIMHLQRKLPLGMERWGFRFGINTGQVVAGVIGRDKLSYDIWGSTVNIASRVESAGQVDKVNISENTYVYVRDFFVCTKRGAIPVKNMGALPMYFVEGIRPEYSVDGEGKVPNHDFLIKLQFVRLQDFEEYILNYLEEKLPKDLYYHNHKHTADVYTQVEVIGLQEGLSPEEILILRTAALLHDSGHILDYQTHEEMGVKLAYEILPGFSYTPKQIEEVARLIMATRMPVAPRDKMEMVICDADLDYLGRRDYVEVAKQLYLELRERGLVGDEEDWIERQIAFIDGHEYYTATARRDREENKQEQLMYLKRWLRDSRGAK